MFLNLYYGTLLIPKHSSTVFQKGPIPSTSTGQTTLKKEVVLSKLNLKFSAHSDKHE
jgi:hypothetical protein